YPTLVLEVSNSESFENLSTKLRRWITHTGGAVEYAVGIKIPYSQPSKKQKLSSSDDVIRLLIYEPTTMADGTLVVQESIDQIVSASRRRFMGGQFRLNVARLFRIGETKPASQHVTLDFERIARIGRAGQTEDENYR